MKILWIINIAIPQIANALGEESVPVGGWMVKLADEVAMQKDVQLHIVFPYKQVVNGTIAGVGYSGFSNRNCEGDIKNIIMQEEPDVVHIFGTEYIHSYYAAKVCEELGLIDKTVVSIQGLVSAYSRHYTGFLPCKIVKGKTFRDILKGNVERSQKKMAIDGEREILTLRRVKHVIGRTDWDQFLTKQINPKIQYHFNNEMLRTPFYLRQWNINACERYTVFCSQAAYPIKGIHLVLEAISMLKEKYPDIKLYIAGKNFIAKPKYKQSYYEKYVLRMIDELELQNHVFFTGFLDENSMCEKYLKSHVFVSGSSIENSPNSVCEAMILGMPVVSSMVGGVANLLQHNLEGFYYQADAPYMLAGYLDKLFENDELSKMLGENARKRAMKRHDVNEIVMDLLSVYSKICR